MGSYSVSLMRFHRDLQSRRMAKAVPSELTCIYPLAIPLSLLCSNQTKPYNHSRPRSSQRRYSSAFAPVLIPLKLAELGSEARLLTQSSNGLFSLELPPNRSGIGDGGSGSARERGSGGICRILKEKTIEPSEKREVSGKDENAL